MATRVCSVTTTACSLTTAACSVASTSVCYVTSTACPLTTTIYTHTHNLTVQQGHIQNMILYMVFSFVLHVDLVLFSLASG